MVTSKFRLIGHGRPREGVRIPKTLRATPAMAAGLTEGPWRLRDLVALAGGKDFRNVFVGIDVGSRGSSLCLVVQVDTNGKLAP